MALPKQLKAFNVFIDGNSFAGVVESITLPNLERKLENYRGGGMEYSVAIDMGGADDALNLEFTMSGFTPEISSLVGKNLNSCMLRFAGSVQQDDTGDELKVEINASGRLKNADMGELKVGDMMSSKYSMLCSYFRLDVDGKEYREIDVLNMVHKIEGEDVLAKRRANIGL